MTTDEFTPGPDDLTPGTVIRVPARYRGRPFCLEIIKRVLVSKETGAVELFGTVLSLDGTTTRKRPLHRIVVEQPDRLVVVRKASR
jgi:hypothetical protein